jgi:exonuclease III
MMAWYIMSRDTLDRPQPSLAIAGDRRVAVLSINVNGFNAACFKGLLEYFTQQYDSHDVLLLQEVKLAPAKQAAARDSLLRIGYTHVATNSIAGSNGVLIAVRSTLVNPIFTCDIPGCDLPDARGRIMTMTTSDPPVTVVCAYLPFCNPLTDDIAPRCSAFRARFTQYITELAEKTPHRQRSLIVAGDLQVALTDRDESVTLVPPGPGSTYQERLDHSNFVSTCNLVDSYRALRPTGAGHTCRSTYPKWTRGRSIASKRIDYVLSPLQPLRTAHNLIDDFTYTFSDHAAVYAAYSIPSTQPTPFNSKTKEGQGSPVAVSLSALLSSREKLIQDILQGNIRKFDPPPPVPEDANVPHAKGVPPMWDDLISKIST